MRIAALVAALHVSGVVLVAHDGRPVFAHAYGLSDRATRRLNRLDTEFNLASVAKMFTGVAVAQLVEQGKLRFADRVGRYVPGLPRRIGARVTIAELLDHTSGLGDYFSDPGYDRLRPRLRRLVDYLPLIVQERLAFRPGSRFGYSNSGFILAGLVVERVTGMSFERYLERHVWGPAGMRHTSCLGGAGPGRAVGYTDSGVSNTATLPPSGTSAGGCYSTAGDLLRFANALLANRLLDRRLTRVVTAAHVRAPGGAYGYGFGRRGETIWHNGGAPGVAAEVDVDQRRRLTLIVLENRDPTRLRATMSALRRALGIG